MHWVRCQDWHVCGRCMPDEPSWVAGKPGVRHTLAACMQDEAVEYVAATMQRLYEERSDRKRLFLIQTYNIGKERVFLEVGRALPRCCCLGLRQPCYEAAAVLGWCAAQCPGAVLPLELRAADLLGVCRTGPVDHA